MPDKERVSMSQERMPPTLPPEKQTVIEKILNWDDVLKELDKGEIIAKTAGCLLVLSTVGMGAVLLVKHLPHIVWDLVEKVKRGKDER